MGLVYAAANIYMRPQILGRVASKEGDLFMPYPTSSVGYRKTRRKEKLYEV